MKKLRIPIQLKASDIPNIREQLLKKQGGVCAICGEIPKRSCLDHFHKKRLKGHGLVRGVCCSNCNVLLGKMENNSIRYGVSMERLPFILQKMSEYLQQPPTNYMHPSEAPKPKKLMKSSFNQLKKLCQKQGIKCPAMSKSGKITKPLQKAFDQVGLTPKFYGVKNG